MYGGAKKSTRRASARKSARKSVRKSSRKTTMGPVGSVKTFKNGAQAKVVKTKTGAKRYKFVKGASASYLNKIRKMKRHTRSRSRKVRRPVSLKSGLSILRNYYRNKYPGQPARATRAMRSDASRKVRRSRLVRPGGPMS